MLELIGLIGGGIFRLLPEILKLINAKRDADHELRMTRLQLEIDQARATQAIDMVQAQSAAAQGALELQGLLEAVRAQATPTGVGWADALSASVRPVLTYWWCLGLYTSAKTVAIVVAFQAGADLQSFSSILVTEFDRGIIASIFGFWFVDRAIRRS